MRFDVNALKKLVFLDLLTSDFASTANAALLLYLHNFSDNSFDPYKFSYKLDLEKSRCNTGLITS